SQSTSTWLDTLLKAASPEAGKLWNSTAHKHALHQHNINIPKETEVLVKRAVPELQNSYKADSTPTRPSTTEDERRSRNYKSLVRAQRRYAEKLSIPTGPTSRFTKDEWDSLGENFRIEDWEGGFLHDNTYQ